MVSSLYGHGEIDSQGLREKCDRLDLKDSLLAGGNLVVGKQNFEDVEQHFLKMGFTKVYPPNTDINESIKDLDEILDVQR